MSRPRAALLCLALLLACRYAHSATITIGQSAILPNDDCCNANMVLGQHTPVPQACRALDMSFYATQAGGQLYLGIYADSGGAPGALLATTAVFTPVAGWNKRVLTTTPQISGAVWLTYAPSSSSLGFRKQSLGQGSRYWTRSAFGPLPSAFATSTTSSSSQWSMYATCETAPPTPPGAPGAPAVSFNKFGSMSFAWDWSAPTEGEYAPLAGFRLYVGQTCPGPSYTSVPAADRSATVPHLAWGVNHVAKVTAIDNLGGESECSTEATGQPN